LFQFSEQLIIIATAAQASFHAPDVVQGKDGLCSWDTPDLADGLRHGTAKCATHVYRSSHQLRKFADRNLGINLARPAPENHIHRINPSITHFCLVNIRRGFLQPGCQSALRQAVVRSQLSQQIA
jgi:hypothetical protein